MRQCRPPVNGGVDEGCCFLKLDNFLDPIVRRDVSAVRVLNTGNSIDN